MSNVDLEPVFAAISRMENKEDFSTVYCAVAALRRQLAEARDSALEEAELSVTGEYLVCDPDNSEDESYNRGITHALEAIRSLKTQTQEA